MMDDIMTAALFIGLSIGGIPLAGMLIDFICDKVLK